MKQKSLRLVALAGFCVMLSSACGYAASPSFSRDCAALTSRPHRLTGTPEYGVAAEYIENRLKSIGADRVIVQTFPAVQTSVKRCELRIDGNDRPIRLLPMRPNGIIPPVTPLEGISGRLVHAGSGKAEDFAEQGVRGAIVVLDYNAGEGWLRAFRLGAKAVVFVRNGVAEAWHPHYVDACVNLPRFYYPGSRTDLMPGAHATIHSEVVWEGVVGRNIFAFFRGTNPVFNQGKDELIIIAAHLDSFGEVPRLSPGARAACNCAALLKLAEDVKKNRPHRHILIAFFDGQARSYVGSSAFYRALESEDRKAKVEHRQKSLEAEWKFLDGMSTLLRHDEPLEQDVPVRRHLLERLRGKAAELRDIVGARMYELRDERHELRQQSPLGLEAKSRIEEISTELKEKWQPEKDRWNDLRRALGRDRRDEIRNLSAEVREKLQIVLAGVRRDVNLRIAELRIEEQSLQGDAALKDLMAEHWISLHLSLLLGDTTPRWGLLIGGDSAMHSEYDNPGLYGKIQTVFLQAYQNMEAQGRSPAHFVTASVDQTLRRTRVLWGTPFLVHSGEVAGLFGIYNLCLATCQERLAREGTPDDTLSYLDLDRIETQAAEIERLLFAVADHEGLSLRRGIVAGKEYKLPFFENENVHGPIVLGMFLSSSLPNTPIPGAIVQFRLKREESFSYSYNRNKPYAFDDFQIVRTSRNGVYALGPVSGVWPLWNEVYRGFAAVFDSRGAAVSASNIDSLKTVRWRQNTFRCRSGVLVLPPQLQTQKIPGDEVRILSSRANAVLDTNESFAETVDGVVCWYVDEREKGVKLFGLRQLVGLNNGDEALGDQEERADTDGEGYSIKTAWEPMPMAMRSASDLWRLNDARLVILQRKNILDSSLAELHGRAEDLLIAASKETSPVRREALSASGFWASQPVYRKTRGMLDDLVFAVLILLALSVPFAFAVERVVIGATTIYKQIGWFVAFFVMTFLTLYFSHPAFAIANTPIIIFLGFAIVVMSVLVISIIMRKFEVELKALQGMTSTLHAADISRVSTFIAAMQMGISTMRRRPLRTALTAVTIILLTFTILCFASFGTKSGIITLFSAPNPGYSGVWLHNVNWSPLATEFLDVIRGRWEWRKQGTTDGGQEKIVTVCQRLWICPESQENPGSLITRKDGASPVPIRGVLGIQPEELLQRADLAKLFGTNLVDTVLITESVAQALEVQPGDRVLLMGLPLRVGPLLETVAVCTASDMDGSSVLPVDFTQVSSEQATAVSEEETVLSRRSWASLPVDSVAVVSAKAARALGAVLYGVTLYTRDTADAAGMAEDLARMAPFSVAATRSNGVYLHVLGTVLAASGVKDLFFPVLLGGLVIFGTMLGSVSDREREIYTFSALGLAPRHVAMLFFAESIVYSLIGGMGGYLLAQATVKILTFLTKYGWVRVPEMNMSSTNTIITILIVMATVVVSAIYPAIKASRSANPGLMRMWRPPEPKDNVLDLVFPFTVSEYDITGVVSFLKEHFDNYSDTGLGQFMARDARLVKQADGMLGLNAFLALAPFDLGVSQSFALQSVPSEISGIDEVRIRLERKSGQPKDWQRLNKVFLDGLRRQFLIWRSIPHETMETYRQRTLIALGKRKSVP